MSLRTDLSWHFKSVAPRYRALRNLDVRAIRRVSLELAPCGSLARRVEILDVGAGTRRYTEAVLREVTYRGLSSWHCVAYDATREMLMNGPARERLGSGSIDCVVGLAECLPVRPGSVHVVFSFNAVHYFDLTAFIDEAVRALSRGGKLIIYTRTPEQNSRTIWGQHFPHFADREIRLYSASVLRAACAAVPQLGGVRVVELPWRLRTSFSRLMEQARSRVYSTFEFYSVQEFRDSLEAFGARIRARFDDLAAIPAQNDHVLVLATRR